MSILEESPVNVAEETEPRKAGCCLWLAGVGLREERDPMDFLVEPLYFFKNNVKYT